MQEVSIPAWPNVARAAEIIGVHPATLLRSGLQLHVELAGRKEKLVEPASVLAAALHFRRKPLSEVGAALIETAERKAPSLAQAVAQEVDRVLDTHSRMAAASADELLEVVRESFPPRVYDRMAAIYRRGAKVESTTKSDPSRAPDERGRGARARAENRAALVP